MWVVVSAVDTEVVAMVAMGVCCGGGDGVCSLGDGVNGWITVGMELVVLEEVVVVVVVEYVVEGVVAIPTPPYKRTTKGKHGKDSRSWMPGPGAGSRCLSRSTFRRISTETVFQIMTIY